MVFYGKIKGEYVSQCWRGNVYQPKWSKAKKHLKSFLSPSLKNKVDYQIINYRKAHDRLGRAVITVDKKEIWNMCTITAEIAHVRKERAIIRTSAEVYDIDSPNKRWDLAHEQIKGEGIFAQYDFFDALQEYYSTPINVSLQSSNILIKILGLMDRRVGKRTLIRLNGSFQTESELVQLFYKLRCEAEGIKVYK